MRALIEELVCRYARSEFELRVPRLEFVPESTTAIVGPSGSGKTTLLRALGGVSVPESGRISIGDFVVSEASDRARRAFRIQNIGFVFQEFELVEYLSAWENILLPFRLSSALKRNEEALERASRIAESAGIADKLRRNVGALSQGERQRVAICRALAPAPSLLLADEPTGNLDPANKGKAVDLMLDMARDLKATVAFVTHDAGLLGRFDRVVDLLDLEGGER